MKHKTSEPYEMRFDGVFVQSIVESENARRGVTLAGKTGIEVTFARIVGQE